MRIAVYLRFSSERQSARLSSILACQIGPDEKGGHRPASADLRWRALQLGDDHRLVDRRWRVIDEAPRAIGGDEVDLLAEVREADFLHHEVASEWVAVSTMIAGRRWHPCARIPNRKPPVSGARPIGQAKALLA